MPPPSRLEACASAGKGRTDPVHSALRSTEQVVDGCHQPLFLLSQPHYQSPRDANSPCSAAPNPLDRQTVEHRDFAECRPWLTEVRGCHNPQERVLQVVMLASKDVMSSRR